VKFLLSLSERPVQIGRVAVVFVGVLLLGGACAGSTDAIHPAKDQVTGGPLLHLDVDLPARTAETCFNAWDDNQNTLIDEGCDVDQGPFQVAIAWDNQQADVDLYVRDPAGEVAGAAEPTNAGLVHSGDCPSEDKRCGGQNYENIYQEEPDLKDGTYTVYVRLEKLPKDALNLSVALGVRVPHHSFAHKIEFTREGQEQVLKVQVVGTPASKKESELPGESAKK
jgi:hypothetical protein